MSDEGDHEQNKPKRHPLSRVEAVSRLTRAVKAWRMGGGAGPDHRKDDERRRHDRKEVDDAEARAQVLRAWETESVHPSATTSSLVPACRGQSRTSPGFRKKTSKRCPSIGQQRLIPTRSSLPGGND